SSKHSVQKKHISEEDPSKWELPTISKDLIYEKSSWKFLYGRGIHIEEFTTSVLEKQMSIQLLDRESIQKHLQEGFRYIHFGCVQITVKPFVRLGLDCPIMLALRAKSLICFRDSLLALINTNICQGAVTLTDL
ncbi:ORF I: Movement protein, partial [Bienertia sinuspersici]